MIGLELDKEQHQLNTITHKDPIQCYSEVFSLWQNQANPPFTWNTITIEGLRSPTIKEKKML